MVELLTVCPPLLLSCSFALIADWTRCQTLLGAFFECRVPLARSSPLVDAGLDRYIDAEEQCPSALSIVLRLWAAHEPSDCIRPLTGDAASGLRDRPVPKDLLQLDADASTQYSGQMELVPFLVMKVQNCHLGGFDGKVPPFAF